MKIKAFVYIILAGVLWGTSAIFVNLLSPYGFTPVQLTAVRSCVALILLGSYILINNKRAFLTKSRRMPLFVALALTLFGSMFFYYTAMVRTSVCTAVMLLNLHPIYVTAFSAVFYKERLSAVKIASVAVMLLGCSFVSGIFGGFELDTVGFVFGVLSGVSYAAYLVFVKYYNREGVAGSTANLYTFFFMAVIAISVCRPANLFEIAFSNPISTLPLLICLGIFTAFVPFLLNGVALRDLSAGTVSALSIIEPLSATIYSVVLFDEQMDLWKLIGVITILGAVVMIGLDEMRPRKFFEDRSCKGKADET